MPELSRIRKSWITPTRVVVLLVVVGVTSGVWKSYRESVAFETTVIGDTQTQVIARFGKPDYVEPAGQPYMRYTSTPCSSPCHARLWWEDDWLPGVGALSVELDAHGRVLSKYRWVSP